MSTDNLKDAPSLQHLVRMIRPTVAATANAILAPKPKIRVFEANHYVRAVFAGMSPAQALSNAEKDPRPTIRKTALEVVPLIEQYLSENDVRWFKPIPPVTHQISPSVRIPIKPLGIARVGDKVVVLWPQLWKTISLSPEQFNIFASYMKYGLLDKFPDYHDFHWLEMSVPKGKKLRELRVRTVDAAQLLEHSQLRDVEQKIEDALMIADGVPKADRQKKPKDPQQDSFL